MLLTDILPRQRVEVAPSGADPTDKEAALRALARLLAGNGQGGAPDGSAATPLARHSPETFFRVLAEREALQSTGVGDGVGIPHGALEDLDEQRAAMLICPRGVPFDAIDQRPVQILLAVVGPRRNAGEHLRTLARISRLLQNTTFRDRLLGAPGGDEAWELVRSAEDPLAGGQ